MVQVVYFGAVSTVVAVVGLWGIRNQRDAIRGVGTWSKEEWIGMWGIGVSAFAAQVCLNRVGLIAALIFLLEDV